MEFPTTYTTFTIPSGATTGARIVINENGSGTIRVYNDSNQLVDVIGGPEGDISSFSATGYQLVMHDGVLYLGLSGNPLADSPNISAPNNFGSDLFLSSGIDTGTAKAILDLIPGVNGSPTGSANSPIAQLKSDGATPVDFTLTGSLYKNGASWQTPTFGTGWATGATSGAYPPFRWRYMAEDTIWAFGVMHTTSATNSAIPVTNLPSISLGGDVGVFSMTNHATNESYGCYINNSGELRFTSAHTLPSGTNVLMNAQIPLGNLV